MPAQKDLFRASCERMKKSKRYLFYMVHKITFSNGSYISWTKNKPELYWANDLKSATLRITATEPITLNKGGSLDSIEYDLFLVQDMKHFEYETQKEEFVHVFDTPVVITRGAVIIGKENQAIGKLFLAKAVFRNKHLNFKVAQFNS